MKTVCDNLVTPRRLHRWTILCVLVVFRVSCFVFRVLSDVFMFRVFFVVDLCTRTCASFFCSRKELAAATPRLQSIQSRGRRERPPPRSRKFPILRDARKTALFFIGSKKCVCVHKTPGELSYSRFWWKQTSTAWLDDEYRSGRKYSPRFVS